MKLIWRADTAIQQAINRGWHSDAANVFFRYLTYLGLDQVVVPLILAFILYRPLRTCGITCLVSYAIAGLGSSITKYFLDRLRPGAFVHTLLAPDEKIYQAAFPSGHTTIAFAVAWAIALSWPQASRKPAAAIALLLAFGVGLSRVYRGVHWPTDALGGAILGLLGAICATLILRAYRRASTPTEAAPQHPSEALASDQP